MLKHIHFLVSCSLQGGRERIKQQRKRLGFRDSVTRSVAALAAIPQATEFATASAGVLQP